MSMNIMSYFYSEELDYMCEVIFDRFVDIYTYMGLIMELVSCCICYRSICMCSFVLQYQKDMNVEWQYDGTHMLPSKQQLGIKKGAVQDHIIYIYIYPLT